MSVIAAYNPAVRVPKVPDLRTTVGTEEKPAPLAETTEVEGVKVTISADAFNAAGKAASANADIDESGLDDNVKEILKMIRQLKQQIAEKMAELQALATQQNLTPEELQAKTSILQTAISSLQAGLMTAQISLAKAMKGMSSEDVGKVMALSN